MDRITDSKKPSKTYQCKGCNAHWRFYNEDVETEFNPERWHDTRFWVKCAECGQRVGVTFVLSFSMKHQIELDALKKRREEEDGQRKEDE